VLFVLAIIVVVMVHESGHFGVAKLFGFKATKFFFGFGPTVWSFTKGETEYGIKAIPAGGFVKIVGMNPYEEVPAKDVPRSYPNKPAWQRALLVVAGSATHWVLAFALLFVAALALGFPTGRATNEITALQVPSPAARAGFRPGDRIVAVGGTATQSWREIRNYIRRHGDRLATFTLERGGRTKTVSVRVGRALFSDAGRLIAYAPAGKPLRRPRDGEIRVGFLGVEPQPQYHKDSLAAAVVHAGQLTWELTRGSVMNLGAVFRTVVNGEMWSALSGHGARAPGQGPLSVVGLAGIAGTTFARGQYVNLVLLIAGLTVFVGLVNLLPLPPLDGGHLAVVAYEAVTGRRVDVRKLIPVAAIVISFFVVLFVTALYLDIVRPVRLPL
jgi:membrane-associated protease RseP (regulator of RpoE activity)